VVTVCDWRIAAVNGFVDQAVRDAAPRFLGGDRTASRHRDLRESPSARAGTPRGPPPTTLSPLDGDVGHVHHDTRRNRKRLEVGAVSELHRIARFKFHNGKLEEFKRLSAQCLEIVRTKDTGTLQYEIYFHDDQSECIVVERYRDSEALIEHTANLGKSGSHHAVPVATGTACTPQERLLGAVRTASGLAAGAREVGQLTRCSRSDGGIEM
jgi:quinol monooxygenase YgiN